MTVGARPEDDCAGPAKSLKGLGEKHWWPKRWSPLACHPLFRPAGVSAVSATQTAPAPTLPEHRPYRHPEGFAHFPLPPRPGSIPGRPPRDAEVPARVSMGMCRSFPGTGSAGISHNIAQERQVHRVDGSRIILRTGKGELFRRDAEPRPSTTGGATLTRNDSRVLSKRLPPSRPQPGAPQRTSQRPDSRLALEKGGHVGRHHADAADRVPELDGRAAEFRAPGVEFGRVGDVDPQSITLPACAKFVCHSRPPAAALAPARPRPDAGDHERPAKAGMCGKSHRLRGPGSVGNCRGAARLTVQGAAAEDRRKKTHRENPMTLAQLAVLCVALAPLALAASARAQTPPRVQIEGGSVVGVRTGTLASYKGIPFAAPPVRELRWRAPQPVVAWQGELVADRFSPMCLQPLRPKNSVFYLGEEPSSEDCLYLNVWSTAAAGRQAAGHGLRLWRRLDHRLGRRCRSMAARPGGKGAVVVSFNYRVGALGFLAHPELTAEGAAPSGNYGLMDMIAALNWVKANIARFGGDPATSRSTASRRARRRSRCSQTSPQAAACSTAPSARAAATRLRVHCRHWARPRRRASPRLKSSRRASLKALRNLGGDAIMNGDNNQPSDRRRQGAAAAAVRGLCRRQADGGAGADRLQCRRGHGLSGGGEPGGLRSRCAQALRRAGRRAAASSIRPGPTTRRAPRATP